MLNLLSNAIKFTGPGGQIIVSTVFSDAREATLRVRDTGAGMSEKQIAAALEPFADIDAWAKSGACETEFGLPLTKALAEANHAQFRIKSAPGPELWSRSRSRAIVRSPTEGAAPRRALRSSFCRDCR